MRLFDLHCDTLYRAVKVNKSLNEPDFQLSFNKGKNIFETWQECTAVWIPDKLSGNEALMLFNKAHKKLIEESKRLKVEINNIHAQYSFLLTVENASLLNGKLDNISFLSDCGVRMITLTWNDENCIGGGADAQNIGLKDFGRKAVKELENKGIIIDLSHASDKLFYDVAQIATEPLVASHSNSRAVTNHRRNLTDEQFKIICDRQGIVGLNFCIDFLSENSKRSSADDVIKHAEHFLSLGGENTLCIGSDFDGADLPSALDSIEKLEYLYELFLKRGFNEQVVQKIMYDNAHNFFLKF